MVTEVDGNWLKRFEALVHASPEFIAIADLSGRVEFVNNAGRRMIGMDADVDVQETTIADYLTPEGLEASVRIEQPAVQRDGHWTGRSTLRDWRGGPPIPVAVSSFELTDVHTGEALAMATVQHDLRELLAETERANASQAALEESERRQRALLLHMSDVLVVVQADGTLTYASPSAGRLLGYEEGTRLGVNVLELIHADDRAATISALESIVRQPGGEASLRLRLLAADGSSRYYEALANNLIDEPSVGGIVIVGRDVTDRHRVEAGQTLQSRALELIANGAPIGQILEALAVWIEELCEGARCSIFFAEEAEDGVVLRYSCAPSMPQLYRETVDGIVVESLSSPSALAISTREPVLVADVLSDPRWAPFHKVGKELAIHTAWAFPVFSPASGRVIGAIALYHRVIGLPDESTRRLVERASHLMGITVDRDDLVRRLAHQATHDALTGLPNRALLLERLSAAMERPAAHDSIGPVVIFLDLDRLKIVNDSLGHERGDELLMRIAERLPDAVPDDVVVARFGGDEFVLLCEQCESTELASQIVRSVLDSISQPMIIDGRQINPSASAGVVVAAPGQSAMEVLRDADIAMYRAKARGGSSFQFADEHMRQRAFDRLELEEQIRSGLRRDEFDLVYQPIVDLDTSEIVGLEALVRWNHPERGVLTPDTFIDLAEETGLIVPLGEHVLRKVAATAQVWAEYLPRWRLSISVNISARQLSPDLITVVSECAQQIAPWSLCLELTESTLMEETLAAREVVDKLQDSGVQVSIDDFGTGFSSLAYLTRLQVDNLKIDRSFVWDLDEKPEAATVAEAVIGLGHALRLTVIAEGIETVSHHDALRAMGCRYGQGYLFGRPVDADQTLQILAAQAPRKRMGFKKTRAS